MEISELIKKNERTNLGLFDRKVSQIRDFSVLMSVYILDNPDHFKQALDSIVANTVLPRQIVIVFDGPVSQEVRSIVDALSKNPTIEVTTVILDQNRGLGFALNEGMKYVKYDLVARVDSDDINDPMRFSTQLDVFQDKPELSVVGSNVAEFNNSLKIQNYRRVPETNQAILKFMRRRNGVNHPSVMFRKDTIQKAGGYQSLIGFEDYYLWVRVSMLNNTEFCNVQKNLVYMRAGEDLLKRRGGKGYVSRFIKLKNFQILHRRASLLDYAISISGMIVSMIIPISWRKILYEKILRA